MSKKGLIIVGYQGIGKSTLAKDGNGYIDLESGNFWVNGKRADDWYIPYCNIAMHLAQQGYIVFTSSHQVVRDYLSDNAKDIELAVCYPDYQLKDVWIKKLEDRYNQTKLEKDYKAWQNAVDRYDENIDEIRSSKRFHQITILGISYDLNFIIGSFKCVLDYQKDDFTCEITEFHNNFSMTPSYEWANKCEIRYRNEEIKNIVIPNILKEHLDSCIVKDIPFAIIMTDIDNSKVYLNSLSDDEMSSNSLELKNYFDKVGNNISNIVKKYMTSKEGE